jgi:hypothetical protein
MLTYKCIEQLSQTCSLLVIVLNKFELLGRKVFGFVSDKAAVMIAKLMAL